MLDRRVHLIDKPDPDNAPRRFSEFAQMPNLVLLGDPGSGKTTVFEQAAQQTGSQYLKARNFLNTPADQLSRVLFIDAIDEQRATSIGDAAIDAIVRHLWEAKPTKVRLACREQEWLGGTDLGVFNTYFQPHGDVNVLRLLPIERDEQIEILIANGVGRTDALQFLTEAETRGFSSTITNPQKMLMLQRVRTSGVWPSSTTELFRRATDLQLVEDNVDHGRTAKGKFTPEELRLPAGAACAARLIADVDGICLEAKSNAARFPTYRNIDYVAVDKLHAALHRPFFVTTGPPNCVDYDHRTGAEFLAAHWIADQISNNALPIGRVQALLGVGGRPVAELRGLNAWMPIALPAHAALFIESDPLGILEYGDAASLSPALRKTLLQALTDYAEHNPWFMGRDRNVTALGQLVQSDSVEALCELIENKASPRDMRTLALEAFGAAKPQPGAFDSLMRVMLDTDIYWGDRHRALECVLAFGARGDAALLKAFPALMNTTEDDLRLRGWTIKSLYGKGLGAKDVIALINDLATAKLSGTVGLLWELADAIPVADLAAVIDGLAATLPRPKDNEPSRLAWDAASFIDRVMGRVLADRPYDLDGPRTYAWIKLRQRLRSVSADGDAKSFWKVIKAQYGLPRRVFDAAVDVYKRDPQRPGFLHRLVHEVLFPCAEVPDITDWCLERLQNERDADKHALVFELALFLSRGESDRAREQFAAVYDLGQETPAYQDLMRSYLICDLSHRETEFREKAKAREREREEDRDETRRKYAANRDAVREGKSYLLNFGADIYFGNYSNFDNTVSPRERIAKYLSPEDAEALITGFRAYALDDARPTPSLKEILRLRAKGNHITSWPALVAGADIIVAAGEIQLLDQEVIAAVMMLDLFGSYTDRVQRKTKSGISFQQILRTAYPAIAADVYVRAIEFDLSNKSGGEFIHGFHEYTTDEIFAASRRAHLLKWVERHRDLSPRTLDTIIDTARADQAFHAELKKLAASALADPNTPASVRPLWLATAYLLDKEGMRPAVKAALKQDPNTVWAIRDALGYESRLRNTALLPLSGADLGFLIAEIGAAWPHANHPSGWSGNTNPWDASELIQDLINRLSGSTSPDHTLALEALLQDTRLASYKTGIRHALAQHLTLRREKEYERPNWTSALAALANRAPVNPADLHALTVAHLHDLAKHIDGGNNNAFEAFWNEPTRERPATPKREEACRNALLEPLRHRLMPIGLNVEPEGAMSKKKRVDIAVFSGPLKAVAEVKLAHSPDLWSALSNQLDDLYTRDPATGGYGVLVVIWFGAQSTKPVTTDAKRWRAKTPQSLQDAIAKTNTSHRLAVVVIDVSATRASDTAKSIKKPTAKPKRVAKKKAKQAKPAPKRAKTKRRGPAAKAGKEKQKRRRK